MICTHASTFVPEGGSYRTFAVSIVELSAQGVQAYLPGNDLSKLTGDGQVPQGEAVHDRDDRDDDDDDDDDGERRQASSIPPGHVCDPRVAGRSQEGHSRAGRDDDDGERRHGERRRAGSWAIMTFGNRIRHLRLVHGAPRYTTNR